MCIVTDKFNNMLPVNEKLLVKFVNNEERSAFYLLKKYSFFYLAQTITTITILLNTTKLTVCYLQKRKQTNIRFN